MDERYQEVKKILDRKGYFKLICGAGNENLIEIKRLSTIYTLAGATAIDVSAKTGAIKSVKDGIDIAKIVSRLYHIPIPFIPLITVSVHVGEDLHFRKAYIDPAKCTSCKRCLDVCDQKAIQENADTHELYIFSKWCIGCGKCKERCAIPDSIGFTISEYNLLETLALCVEAGAESIELHASTPDDLTVLSAWSTLVSFTGIHQLSLCLGRSHVTEEQFITRIKETHFLAGDRMIVQADGDPMSGDEDDYHTTLQAIATADLIFKNKVTIPVIVSGGTNSKTKELAGLCGVNINGVSVGSYARKIVRSYITSDRFDEDTKFILEAVSKAEKLVKGVTQCKE